MQKRKPLGERRIPIGLTPDRLVGADLANRRDIGGFAVADVKRAGFPVEIDTAFRSNLAVARNRRAVHLPPEGLRIVGPRDAAFIIVTAEHAVMARKIGRLTGPDQRNLVAHLAQMSRSRRPDQTSSDHRKLDRLIHGHG